MAYTKQQITEVLSSVEKIGAAKTARLYNIRRSTIYNWINKAEKEEKIKKSIKNDAVKNDINFVFRRIYLKNDSFQFYIYSLKDENNGYEFSGISFENNYKTPECFLKYVINLYQKSQNINKIFLKVKGFSGIKNLDKFKNITKSCLVELTRITERQKSCSFSNREIISVADKKELLNILTLKQLLYNYEIDERINSRRKILILPIIIDKYQLILNKNSDIKELLEINNRNLNQTLQNMLKELKEQIRESRFILAEHTLLISGFLAKEFGNPDLLIKYYQLVNDFYKIQGNYGKAIAFFDNELLNTSVNEEVIFFIYLLLTIILLDTYQIKRADLFLEKLKNINSEKLQTDILYDYELLLVKRESLEMDFSEKREKYQNILKKYQSGLSERKTVEIYLDFALLYQKHSFYQEAYSYLKRTAFILKKLKDNYLTCLYYERKGYCLYQHGQFDEAFEIFMILEEEAEKYGYNYLYFESLSRKATYFLDQGDFEKAISLTDKVLSYGIINNQEYVICRAYRIFENIYFRKNYLKKALDYCEKEYQICKHFQNPDYEASTLNNYSYILLLAEENEKALEYLELFYKLAKKLNDSRRKIQSRLFQAYIYHDQGRIEKSLKTLKSVISFSKKIKFNQFLYKAYSNVAVIKKDQKEYKAAIYNINQSIYYYQKHDIKLDLPRLVLIKAEIYCSAVNYKESRKFLKEAENLALKYEVKPVLKKCIELAKRLKKK